MTPENFCYWLQGFTELQPGMEQPTPAQWKAITEHLQHVFQKVTPKVDPLRPAPGTVMPQPAGPVVAAPARGKTPAEFALETLQRNPHLGFGQIPALEGITITC
ncbi:hypothetical protein [uncultured Pseudomonas sp.]|uniref:hypothetical protein n=1 Tax=uncultured Pseudomonas sp. TaxID=114707 RepID=UPI0025F2E466|nr:hypothetical protein [uncultured Pseudomonas sp.]